MNRAAKRETHRPAARTPRGAARRDSGGRLLVSYGDMAYSPAWGYWRGTYSGDVRGKAEFHEQPRNFEKDGIEYFFEDFVVETENGILRGTKDGVYDLTTGDFWDHGVVAEASKASTPLIGYRIFERAATTKPGVFPMIGHHTPMVLIPPHPVPGLDDRALISLASVAFNAARRCWTGTLSGDVKGNIEIREEPPTHAIGNTDYVSERFAITSRAGVLLGTAAGMGDRVRGTYAACGTVAEATGRWERALGAMVLRWSRISRLPGHRIAVKGAPFVLVQTPED